MRIPIAAALAIALAAPLAGAPAAAQTLDKDEKKVGKFAVPTDSSLDGNPKGWCVCLDDATAETVHGAGVLTFKQVGVAVGKQIQVECRVLKYDGQTGERVATDVCDDWVPLVK